jgi:hypothetical protein
MSDPSLSGQMIGFQMKKNKNKKNKKKKKKQTEGPRKTSSLLLAHAPSLPPTST